MIEKSQIKKWAYDEAPTRIMRALCRAWIHADLLTQNSEQYRAGILEPAIEDACRAISTIDGDDTHKQQDHTAKNAECDCLRFWDSHHPECPTMRPNASVKARTDRSEAEGGPSP